MRTALIALLASFALASGCTVQITSTPTASATPPAYAHRGGTGPGIENTRTAFRASGSVLWDTDVRWTRTGVPVLLHSADLGVFGCPKLKLANLSLTQARACSTEVTSLVQFVNDVNARGVTAFVELKTRPTASQWAKLASVMGGVRSHVIVVSFAPETSSEAARRGWRSGWLTGSPSTAFPTGTTWVGYDYTIQVSPTVMAAARAAGVKVFVWTPPRSDWAGLPAGLSALVSDDA